MQIDLISPRDLCHVTARRAEKHQPPLALTAVELQCFTFTVFARDISHDNNRLFPTTASRETQFSIVLCFNTAFVHPPLPFVIDTTATALSNLRRLCSHLLDLQSLLRVAFQTFEPFRAQPFTNHQPWLLSPT